MFLDLWVKVLNNGVRYSISHSIINLLSTKDFKDNSIINFIITMFNNAYSFGVPEDIRSVYIHGNVGYRRVYGYVMYIRRYRSVSIHVGVSHIKHDFGNCANYWGWQVLAHEFAHLVGIGGGHYLRHGNVHLNVAKELLLGSLPTEIAIPSTYYLLIDYSLGDCKRGYSSVSRRLVIDELDRLVGDYSINPGYYINCSDRLLSLMNTCSKHMKESRDDFS
ncbi:MAG: hypothetical protein ACP5GZ_07520 [Vulcanisaeta sp.]|jgi:hypothetical protein|uniref:hypothetical protein n=1 Tax=Vulcanisaeta sp. TaxID=2020871 RepID=UPI003D151B77